MEKPLISVIVAVYNVENELPRCVESLLGQSYEELELLLIDDGSTDGCPALCQSYAARDSRVRYLRQENQGLSAVRNRGIEEARGAYIAFVDGDDFMDRRYLELLYHDIAAQGVKLAACGFQVVQPGQEPQPPQWRAENTQLLPTREALQTLFTKEKYANYAWNKLYHRSLFQGIRYPLGRKMEDLGTTYKLIARCPLVSYNPAPLCNYVQRGGSILHNRDEQFYRDKVFLTLERYHFLKERYPDLLWNELFLMVVLLDAYPKLPRAELPPLRRLLQRFPRRYRQHFPPRYQKRYRLFCLSPALYRRLYRHKSDKE